jgi:hypothetical protein
MIKMSPKRNDELLCSVRTTVGGLLRAAAISAPAPSWAAKVQAPRASSVTPTNWSRSQPPNHRFSVASTISPERAPDAAPVMTSAAPGDSVNVSGKR